jgi:MscS family membrane protein
MILETTVWKILLSLLVLVLAWQGATRIARLVRRRAAGAGEWHRPAVLLLIPLILGLTVVLALLAIGWEIGLSGPLFDAVIVLATVVLYAAAAWAAWLLWTLVVEAIIALPTIPDDSYDANLLRLLARVASVVSVAAILIYGASEVGVPALSLLAGVSVGGIALALAAQSTVENLFGGISIFADRPFRVGDLIQGASVTGTVERVGPRSSRIRGADGTLTTVPNSDLARMHITNVTTRNGFLFKHLVRLSGDSSRAQVEWLLAALRRRIAAEERVRKGPGLPRVRLVGFGESSIDIEVFAQVPVATQGEFLEVQEHLVLEIMKAVEEGGMRFCFTTTPAAGMAPPLPPASVEAHA